MSSESRAVSNSRDSNSFVETIDSNNKFRSLSLLLILLIQCFLRTFITLASYNSFVEENKFLPDWEKSFHFKSPGSLTKLLSSTKFKEKFSRKTSTFYFCESTNSERSLFSVKALKRSQKTLLFLNSFIAILSFNF
jgi:hypothetical protein